MDDFEIMQELDKLSELKEQVDPRYAPIVEAKINYRLQQMYSKKSKTTNPPILMRGKERRD